MKDQQRLLRRLCSLAVVAGLAVTACGDDDGAGDSTAEPTAEESTAPTAEPTAPTAEEPTESTAEPTAPTAEEPTESTAEESTAPTAEPTAEPTATADEFSGPVEQDTITVGALAPGTTISSLLAGDEAGYFADEGLTLETFFGGGFADQVPLLLSGEVDVAWGSNVPALQAIEGGIDLVLVTEYSGHPECCRQVAYALPESGIQEAADLAGKRIAVNSLGGMEYGVILSALSDAGLTVDDVEIMQLGLDAMPAAIERGDVDVVFLNAPRIPPFLAAHPDAVAVIDMADVVDRSRWSQTAFYTSKAFAEENPNTLAAFERAVERSNEAMAADPEAQIQWYMDLADVTDRELAELSGTQELLVGFDPNRLAYVVEWAKELGLLETDIDPGTLYWRDAIGG